MATRTKLFATTTIDDTELKVWDERDRLHIALYSKCDDQDPLVEWWDEAARDAIEDGFLNNRNRSTLHQSAFNVWRQEVAARAAKRANAKKKALHPPLRRRGGGGSAMSALGVRLPGNSLQKFPSGRWGFVGSVDVRLGYVHEDGSLLDPVLDAEKIDVAARYGPRLAGVKTRAFDTAYDAMVAAKKLERSVNVPPWMIEKDPYLTRDLKRSGVKFVVR